MQYTLFDLVGVRPCALAVPGNKVRSVAVDAFHDDIGLGPVLLGSQMRERRQQRR